MSLDLHRPLAVDLFSGAGGLSLGLEQAGYEIAASVEYDPIHAAVHEFNFPYGCTLVRDVSKITGEDIRKESEIEDKEIALVSGGPPCQGISLIGRRAIDDPRNSLLKEYVRLVVELKPRYFLMENVAGLTVGKHRRLLDEVVSMFDGAGYRVLTPYKVLQAADYGTPQSRKRLILLGSRSDVPPPEYPEPTFFPRPVRPGGDVLLEGRSLSEHMSLGLKESITLGPSVADALGDLPNADDFADLLVSDEVHTCRYGEPSLYASVLRSLIPERENFSHARPVEPNWMTSASRTAHTKKSIERFRQTRPGMIEPVSRFLRLHPEGISNTLRAGTASDRGAYTAPRPIHPTFPRVITVREAARLHGYPDWFRFHVTKWNGFRQIGNSVPPPLGRAIGAALIRVDDFMPSVGRPVPLGDPSLLSMTAGQAHEYYGLEQRVIPQRNRKVSGNG